MVVAALVITLLSSPIARGEGTQLEGEVDVPLPKRQLLVAEAPPEPEPQYTPSTAPVQASTGQVGNGLPSYETWTAIARCESGYGGGPNWSLNSGNGFYGGVQFSLSSWQWVGGQGYPHQASQEEQIHRANILWQRQGWNAWPACSRKLGLR